MRAAASQLAEANLKYNALQAERSSDGALQRSIDEAAVQLADANARYEQLRQQLAAEQDQRMVLQRRAEEASVARRAERLEAQSRYQELLQQLQMERSHRAALEVRRGRWESMRAGLGARCMRLRGQQGAECGPHLRVHVQPRLTLCPLRAPRPPRSLSWPRRSRTWRAPTRR